MIHFLVFFLFFSPFADAQEVCRPSSPHTDISLENILQLASQGEKILSAGAVCATAAKKYREAGCRIQDIRGFSSAQTLPKNPPVQLPGGFFRVIKDCPAKNFERAILAYKRKPPGAGNVPRTDECTEQEFSPPNFYRHITRTVTKRDPSDYSRQRAYSVIEDFDYDPIEGAKLKMVSYAGDEIQCYGGEFDPLQPAEVKYLYCIVQGKKIAPLRKDQFAVIANGRFSVSDAIRLPEPVRLQTSTDFVPEEDQKIPSR